MKRILVVSLALFSQLAFGQVRLEQTAYYSEADANWCGDMSYVVAYDVSSRNEGDLRSTFITEALQRAVTTEIERHGTVLNRSQIIKTHDGDVSRILFERDLGLKQEDDGHQYLDSCYDLEVLRHFDLKAEDGKLVAADDSTRQGLFFTLAEYDARRANATENDYHVYYNPRSKIVTIFTVW